MTMAVTKDMAFADLDVAYEELAQAIDRVGPKNEALFLTKLVLMLAQQSGDLDGFCKALNVAIQDLPER